MFYVFDFLAHEWDEFEKKQEAVDMVMEGADITRQGVLMQIKRGIESILDGIEEGSEKLAAPLVCGRYIVLDRLTYEQRKDIVVDVFTYEGLYAVSDVQFNEVFQIPSHRIRIMARDGDIKRSSEPFTEILDKSAFKKRLKPEDKLKAVVELLRDSDDDNYSAIGELLSRLEPMCESGNRKRAEKIIGRGEVNEIFKKAEYLFSELI